MIKDKSGDKWRANMIILGKRYDLSNVDTFKYLIECGADIHAYDDSIFRLGKSGKPVINDDIYNFLKSKCS